MRTLPGAATWTLVCASALCCACSDDATSSTEGPGGGGATSGAGAGVTTGGDTGGASTTSGPGGGTPIDLCAGLVADKDARPMSALAKPAVGEAVTDPEFGTTIRRVTTVPSSGSNPAIVPMYTTMPAWNADESYLILYSVEQGHQLYDGRTYAFLRALDISPADVEQVYWHTTDPDILFYTDGNDFVRYHVGAAQKEVLTTFDFCDGDVSNGDDPMFTSWDSKRIGLRCNGHVFIYDIGENQILGDVVSDANPAQVAPSGMLAYLSDSGDVTDANLATKRTLDLLEPYGHADLGRLANGHDTWNGVVYDPGPAGNSDLGSLVTFDLTDGSSKVVIGPDTGFPYPPTTHISMMALRQPGWAFVSTIGDTSGAGLLDLENVIADTNTGAFCRVGRHRSFGKENTHLGEPYWAEPHTVPSPSGTRAVFASDWGNGPTVDTYVVELPSYVP